MLDEEQQERIEALRERVDKAHIKIFCFQESPAEPMEFFVCGSGSCTNQVINFCGVVNPKAYETIGEAARAWHYPEER